MRLEVPPSPFYRGRAFYGDPEVPIAVVHIEGGPAFPPHGHDFYEPVLVRSGEGLYESGGAERRIRAGDALFLPVRARHSYARSPSLAYVNLLFDPALLLEEPLAPGLELLDLAPERGAARLRLPPLALREALALANRVDQELLRRDSGYGLMAKALLAQLWTLLCREREWEGLAGESAEARARRVAERIRREPSAERSSADMAEEAGTSERNFRRAFKRATGEAPLAFARRVRIEEAKALLSGSDKTVTQIASLVGFGDPDYFARAFKRATGLAPSAFRRRA